MNYIVIIIRILNLRSRTKEFWEHSMFRVGINDENSSQITATTWILLSL